jgi:tetratricopeptide (TPR) repeat protein
MEQLGVARARTLLAVCASVLVLAQAATGDPAAPNPLAGLSLDAAEQKAWDEGFALEQSESFGASNERYTAIAAAHPDSAFLAWRIARNYWREGERLPVSDKDDRRAAFTQSLDWAQRSLAHDPDCGECVFWAMVSMGRLATTEGVVASARMAAPMAQLIERGIALHPTSRDNEWNQTLGNMYLAASAFYRVVPDWPLIDLAIGVRGNKDRALDYIERAIAIAPMRIDYQVEHGVVLTCIGVERSDAALIARGREVLQHARTMPHLLGTDALDQKNATLLLERPELACGYQRDGFIDLSGVRHAGAL